MITPAVVLTRGSSGKQSWILCVHYNRVDENFST